VTTRFARATTGGTTVNYIGAWTSDQWFATQRLETTPTGGTTSIQFSPRSGLGGATLGSPQVLPLTSGGGFGLYGGDHIVATGFSPIAFFHEAGGTWAPAGTLTLGEGFGLAGITDNWLVARRGFGAPGTPAVQVFSLTVTAGAVVASLAATLTASPTLSPDQQSGFARQVALDGDLIAVSGTGGNAPAPGYVEVFRATAGVWSSTQVVGGTPGDNDSFGMSIGVDDGPTIDRIAVTTPGTSLLQVETFADTGSGFGLEQTLLPPPPGPTAISPEAFGGALAIDGNRLATMAHNHTVASETPGHDPVKVAAVRIYRWTGTTWAYDNELATHTVPATAGVVSTYPAGLQIRDNHIAVNQFITPDPPPGCTFPCIYLGFEAWSLDYR